MLLITGATGLTGRFLIDQICVDNGSLGGVRCLVRKTSDVNWLEKAKPELFYGDVSCVDNLVQCMDGVSGVIHLVNIRHSPQIIEACKRTGVKRVVFVNTTGMFSRYQEYSALYRQLEDKIFDSGLDFTIIRPTMIYGNEQDRNIRKLVYLLNKYKIFPVVGSGTSLMQPIYAEDLAKVVYKAYNSNNSKGKAYNVAGKEALTYIDLLKEITTVLCKTTKFVHIPFFLALIAGKLGDIIPNGLINYERIQRLSEDKAFDYKMAQAELGFEPIPFSEGIKLEVAALRKTGYI